MSVLARPRAASELTFSVHFGHTSSLEQQSRGPHALGRQDHEDHWLCWSLSGPCTCSSYPARTYLAQKQDIAVQERTIAGIEGRRLQADGREPALQGAPTIEQIARQEYGLVKPGQQAFMVVPARTKPAPVAPPPPRHAALVLVTRILASPVNDSTRLAFLSAGSR